MMRCLLFLVAGLTALAAGCDDPFIDPFANEDRWFTVWGWIDPDAARQEVRIIPVTRRPSTITSPDDMNAAVNARVFSIDLGSGAETEWAYRLAQLDDGTYGHVFSASLFVRPADSLRLEVRRSDGRVTWAETVVPTPTPISLGDIGVVYEAENGHLLQDILVRGVERPWSLRVTYRVVGSLIDKWFKTVDYGRSGRSDGQGNWIFTVDLTADQEAIREDIRAAVEAGAVPRPEFGDIPDAGLNRMNVGVLELAETWDLPFGEYDDEVYAFPDALTNVVNGYGYWGSGSRVSQQWEVDSMLSRRLGWPF
jgi:hypothetical protein